MAATIAQQPSKLGQIAVETAVKIVKKEKVEAKQPVAVKTVTKENVATFSS